MNRLLTPMTESAMKRAGALTGALVLALILASCGGQTSTSPAAADLPPRLQDEGQAAAEAAPPYPPSDDPVLQDAPVVGADDPAARQGVQPRTGQGTDSTVRMEDERDLMDADEPHVAALIPNQGPYTPIRELKRVNFGFDNDELTPQAKRILDRNAEWMTAHPEVRVRVEGHCDERGTNEYNLGLGQRRADKVMSYLMGRGVPARMMLAVSFGEEVPLVIGHDAAAWGQNRRVDFSYLEDDAAGQTTTYAPMHASR